MSIYQRFITQLSQEAPVFSAWAGMGEPQVAAILARSAFDAVIFDMQHGAVDFAAVVRAAPLVLAAGKPPLARIPVGDFATASRLLDAGLAGVIAPMINSVEDVRQLAAFCKFPPAGGRSWGPGESRHASGLDNAAYLAQANGLLPAFAMVETREGLAALDGILGVDGVDGVFVGPADLSIALSRGAHIDPEATEVTEALVHVVDRCRAAGKIPAVYAVTPQRARALAGMGFALVGVSGDGALLRAAADRAVATARGHDHAGGSPAGQGWAARGGVQRRTATTRPGSGAATTPV